MNVRRARPPLLSMGELRRHRKRCVIKSFLGPLFCYIDNLRLSGTGICHTRGGACMLCDLYELSACKCGMNRPTSQLHRQALRASAQRQHARVSTQVRRNVGSLRGSHGQDAASASASGGADAASASAAASAPAEGPAEQAPGASGEPGAAGGPEEPAGRHGSDAGPNPAGGESTSGGAGTAERREAASGWWRWRGGAGASGGARTGADGGGAQGAGVVARLRSAVEVVRREVRSLHCSSQNRAVSG